MSDRSIVPSDDSDSRRAHQELMRKLANREKLAPEELQLLVEELALMVGWLARGAAKLVKPAIDRLASPEFGASLSRLASEVERTADERGKHVRAVDAEFRDNEKDDHGNLGRR